MIKLNKRNMYRKNGCANIGEKGDGRNGGNCYCKEHASKNRITRGRK
jgi:hypothetical protein